MTRQGWTGTPAVAFAAFASYARTIDEVPPWSNACTRWVDGDCPGRGHPAV